MTGTSEDGGLDLAVIGFACRVPGAADPAEFWRLLATGQEASRTSQDNSGDQVPADSLSHHVGTSYPVDRLEEFDAAFFGMSPREAALTDPQHRIMLECAYEALEHAGHAGTRGANTGVYVGCGPNEYYVNNLLRNPRALAGVTPMQLQIGNEKDFLANRISYKLDLRGPSVVVQSACSTSLLAVHMAAMAVYTGECDLAIAGGVSVEVPQDTGYLYQEGGIFSPDGHCRPFSGDAAGSVRGNGAGAVVLKRMADALADGDHVYAVLRGCATNNDGAAKIGYAAPGLDGQREVIQGALAVAEVDPDSVGYLEAHGTGTALGDPVEVAAITDAYGARAGGPGVLGSVKSNIGHLDAAAGVAGFIKAVLAIDNQVVPPTLHADVPNPAIDFTAAGFRPANRCVPWEAGPSPRRAAVSSFGVGGSNVHVVLEEPAPVGPRTPAGRPSILRVSGLVPGAVTDSAARLAGFLDADPQVDLADAAFTLRRGRRELPGRMAVVASTAQEAAAALRKGSGASVARATAAAVPGDVVFMFPGQGTQFPGMGAEHHAAGGVYAEELARCAKVLGPVLDLDLLELLHPADAESAARSAELLTGTHLAQPALFAVEYSLARQWQQWGLTPDAMIGHSIGEFVAACLAGVLGLEDALVLVAARGRLMGSMAPGRMLAVAAAYDDIRADLPGSVDLAAVNRPALCVLAGPADDIAALREHFSGRGIGAQPVQTSHAFHSRMMQPCRAEFEAEVARLDLRPPSLPFVSGLTGDWITDEQAVSAAHWADALCAPVRFADGVATAFAAGARLFLECGPGRSLGAAVRDAFRDRDDVADIALLPKRDGGSDAEHHRALVRAQLWCRGLDLDDPQEDSGRRRIGLPTYPFRAERHWIDPVLDWTAVDAPQQPAEHRAEAAAPQEQEADLGLAGRLTHLWCEALGVQSVADDDNFLDLGGDSILSIQIAHRARTFGIPLGPRMVLEFATVAGLVAEIEGRGDAVDEAADADRQDEELLASAWVPRPDEQFEPFPLTDIQHAYWVGRNTPTGAAAVAAHAYEELACDDLDVPRLQQALRALIDRHSMMRAVLTPDGTQRILPEVPDYVIEVTDFTDLSAEQADHQLRQVRDAMSHTVRDVENWPLFDLGVSRLPDGSSRLHVSFDLLITDSWSITVFWRELEARYRDPSHAPAPIGLTFRDYVLAEQKLQESPAFARARDYWLARAEDFPAAPVLPLARRPEELTELHFVRREARFAADVWHKVKRQAAERGLTPSALLCTAYAENLSAWTESPRFCLNLPAFNRLAVHEDIGEVIGDFTSVLLLEVDCGSDVPFRERARQVQRRMWDDVAAVRYSGVRLLREIAAQRGEQSVMPYVFTSLIFRGATDRTVVGGLGRLVDGVSQTPQVWLDCQVFEDRDELVVNWDSIRDLFDPALLDAMFAEFVALVTGLADDEARWSGTGWRDERAARFVGPGRASANETGREQTQLLLHEGFLRHAARTPQAAAVVAGDTRLSYAELDAASRWVAAGLRRAGAVPGDRVAISLAKGWQQAAAVLGVLRAGAVYVPVDPGLPEQRAHTLLALSGARHVITAAGSTAAWPDGVTALAVTDDAPRGGTDADAWVDIEVDPDATAYVIFTSGTTGVPKGVLTAHRAAANTVEDINERFAVSDRDVVLSVSSLSFDLSVYDVFGVLAAGGCLVLPDAGLADDPAHWARLVAREGVTVWNSVPALMDLLLSSVELADDGQLARLRLVLLSGDWIPLTLPSRIEQAAPSALRVSLGGATEASIWSISHVIEQVEPGWRSIPYGTALANQTVDVLDDNLRPRPDLVAGELYIGGRGLAQGYGDADETRRRFVPGPRGRLYRTGDLGRWLPSGEIEFLGRTDTQVKINGFRVEIGEIENTISELAGVAACAVTVAAGGRRLVAYACAEPGATLDGDAVLAQVARTLPGYMVPAACVLLDELPLSGNGKVDRKRLPAVDGDAVRDLPVTASERVVGELWAAVLGHDDFGVTDDFFAGGGDSRQLTELVLRIRAALLPGLPLRDAFRTGTVRALAELVDQRRRSGDVPVPSGPVAHGRHDGPVPVTASQARLWFHEQLSPGSTTYNLVQPFRLSGPLDVAALRAAFEAFVARHDVLSVSFTEIGDTPHQVPAAGRAVPFEVSDGDEATAQRVIIDEARIPFDLADGPHLRVRLVRTGPDTHVLVVSVHHIVWDAWSTSIMVREIAALYRDGTGAALPAPGVGYTDVARWEHDQVTAGHFTQQLDYWRQRLAAPLPVLALPVEGAAVLTEAGVAEGARVLVTLDQQVTARFAGVCAARRSSVFMGYLAAWQVLLQWWCRQRDVVVGVPAGHRAHPQLENTIGFLVNSLAIRTEVTGDPAFDDVLAQVRERALEAYANQDVPFDHVVQAINPVRRSGESAPVFRTWFLLQDVPVPQWHAGEVTGEMLDSEFLLSVHDIKLVLTTTGDGGMEGSIDYRVGLFAEDTVRRLVRCLQDLVDLLSTAPETKLTAVARRLENTWEGRPRTQGRRAWNEVRPRRVPVRES